MIKNKQQQLSLSHQSGFTIIESLVALMVVSLLLAAIAPVIVLSVATRVQARRVELATDAAKSYIDGVRSGTIPAPPITSTSADFPAPAPAGTLTCTAANDYCSSPTTSSARVYCIDGDGGGCINTSPKDLIVQAFGFNSTTNDAQYGYQMGLRVYRADAFKTGVTLNVDATQRTFTGGTGITTNQAPLVKMTTEMTPSTTTDKFKNFCQRLQGCTP